ncbi:STE-domain-containing protein [Lentinula edodes]|uniref:STE-domain-containing protein n=1 Tax=Lentinula edodes TaxID=5353 RepID=A0A1Q3EJX7_LENED|nr:STE-domain-containing protein [Lentinula edodes]
MSRTQLQPLQLNSLPKAHEHDEYTARPGGNRSAPSWNTAPNNTSSSRSSMSGEESSSSAIDPTPGLPLGLSRPLNQIEQEKLAQLDRLKFFLATAPSRWDSNAVSTFHIMLLHIQHSTVFSSQPRNIVRALVFRFDAFGRPVRNMKKFEEGVFSDLRNLKPGQDASLEEPKSPFLDLLFKYQCIRTQKKQKVFYWFSVPHDRLFLDALERDLKREKMGLESTTQVVGEPALSFVYDGAFKRSLYEQFVKAAGGKEGEGELERVVRGLEEGDASGFNGNKEGNAHAEAGMSSDADNDPSGDESASSSDVEGLNHRNQRGVGAPAADNPNSPFFNMFSLFEGSPTYKQRRKKPSRPSALSSAAMASTTSAQHGIVTEGIASNGDIVRGRYDMRTINGTPNSSVSSVNRYSYPPSGEQYALYPTGSTYSHDPRANIGYHPSSSPPNTTQYPILHNSYGMDVGYGQGEYSSNVSAGVRVKQESISAADMFLMQARGGLPNVPFVESRATKRHSYAGSSMETGTIPVWLEGKYTGVDMAASTSTPLPPFANRGKSMDHSMTVSSPYIQAQQISSAASPYMSNVSMSESPPRSSTVSSPRDSRGSPISTSGSPSSVPPAPEVPATLPNPITIPAPASLQRSLGLSGMEWGVNVGEWINSEMDEEAQPSVFSANRGRATNVDADMDDTLSEQPSTADIGVGLNMFGGSGGLGMGMGMSTSVNGNNDYNSYPSSIPSSVASLDVPMELCEVELTGDNLAMKVISPAIQITTQNQIQVLIINGHPNNFMTLRVTSHIDLSIIPHLTLIFSNPIPVTSVHPPLVNRSIHILMHNLNGLYVEHLPPLLALFLFLRSVLTEHPGVRALCQDLIRRTRDST